MAYGQAKTLKEKSFFFRRLKEQSPRSRIQMIRDDRYEFYSQWYYNTLRDFHLQNMALALDSVDTIPRSERDHSCLIVPLSKAGFESVKADSPYFEIPILGERGRSFFFSSL